VAKLRVVTFLSNGPCASNRPFETLGGQVMATGTIKRVVADRGFGFIADDGEKEYFFHRNSLEAPLDFDRLAGGERVEFDVEQSPKGPRANRVRAA
jgi:cold shock protein